MLNTQVYNFKYKNELYQLKQGQYSNNKINLEEWLNFKHSYYNALNGLQSKLKTLQTRFKLIHDKIKNSSHLRRDELELIFLIDLSNQLKSFEHEQR